MFADLSSSNKITVIDTSFSDTIEDSKREGNMNISIKNGADENIMINDQQVKAKVIILSSDTNVEYEMIGQTYQTNLDMENKIYLGKNIGFSRSHSKSSHSTFGVSETTYDAEFLINYHIAQ